MKQRDLLAVASLVVALIGVFLVFGAGWALIVAGTLAFTLFVLLTLADLRKPKGRRNA